MNNNATSSCPLILQGVPEGKKSQHYRKAVFFSAASLARISGFILLCLFLQKGNAQTPAYSSNATATGLSTSATVNKPASVIGGDLMVVGLMFESGSSITITPPAGWTLIRRTDNGTSLGMATYYRVAGNSEGASYTFTLSSSVRWAIGNSRITGANPINPINVSAGSTGASGNVTAPTVTTTSPSNLVLAYYTNASSATFSPAGGSTERYDVPNTTNGLPSNMMASFAQATAGATPDKTATPSAAITNWIGQQVAINSALVTTVLCGPYTVTYTIDPPNNCTASNGSVTINSVVGGSGTITYLWMTVSGHSNVNGQTGDHLSTIKSGIYSVEITRNGIPCTFLIPVYTTNIGIPVAADATICNGSTATLTATGCVQGYIWTLSGNQVGTGNSYTTPILTSTTTYVVVCTNGGGGCVSTEDDVTVNVGAAVTAGSLTAPSPSTACSPADPGNIASAVAGTGSGTITYRWESSVSPFSTWSTIMGESGSSFDPPSGLAATTQYRRITISTLNGLPCESSATTAVQFNINTVAAGTIAADQSLCIGNSDPTTFTNSISGSGAGAITYRWQSNIIGCGGAFADVTPSATGTTYDPPSIAQTTYYRRVAISTLNGVACEAASNCLTVSVTDLTPPVISLCPLTRNIPGCNTGDIHTPDFNPSLTATTFAIFTSSPNSGISTDNCMLSTVQYEDLITNASCPITVRRRWTVTDAAGYTATCDQTINVNDTTAPVGSPPAGSSGINACYIDASTPPAGTPAFNPVTAAAGYSDNCLGAITATLTNTLVTGNNCSWTVTYTFSVQDPCNNTLSSQTIQYSGGDLTAPTGSDPASLTGISGCLPTQAEAEVSFNASYAAGTYSDNCPGNAVSATMTSTIVTGTSCGWSVTYTFSVEDGCGNSLTGRTYFRSGGDQDAPSGSIPANQMGINGCLPTQAEADAAFNAGYAAAGYIDNCSGVNVSLTSAAVSGTSCGWSILYTFSVFDDCSNVTTGATYTRSGSDQTIPSGSNPIAMDIQCIAGIPLPDPAVVTDEADNCGTPSVAFMNDSNNGGTGCMNDVYLVTRTYRITDGCGNTSDVTQTITAVDNIAPTFTAPPDVTLDKDDLCLYDPDDPLAGNVTDEADNCSTGLNATKTDMITDIPCDGSLTVTRTWSLTDDCGNVTTHAQIIDIQDVTAPVLGTLSAVSLTCPDDIPGPVLTLDAFLLLPGATESDNCAGSGSISLLGSVTSSLDGDECGGAVTRTYYVADGCDNSAAAVQTFNVLDDVSPLAVPGQLPACFESVQAAIAGAIAATVMSDNCTPAQQLSVDAEVTSAGCDSLITLTVYDICGNASSVQYSTMINCQAVRLKVFVEGAYNMTTDKMDSTLNELHTLPGQDAPPFYVDQPAGHPYQVAPWNFTNTLGNTYGDGMGMTPYPVDVVDWVLVMVRENGILPANTVWTCAGWLHTDGTVSFPDACPNPTINVNNNYYIVVQHRNHLGIMSPSFVDIGCDGAFINWDFTTSDSYKPIFRFGQKQMETGTWAMFAGNGEQLTSIQAINSPDRTQWKLYQGVFGYSPGDYIMDASTNSTDETTWKNNQNKTTGVVFY